MQRVFVFTRHSPPATCHCSFHFPVPVSETVCGLLLALSLTFIVADRAPVADGVNVTLIEQCPFAGTLAPQVFDGEAKSPGLAPVKVTPEKVSAVLKLLVSVTTLAPLVVPTFCAANVSDVGETVACRIPVPDSEAVCGLFEAL